MTTTITRSPRSRLTSRVNLSRNPKVGTNTTDWVATANGSTPTAARVNGAGGGPVGVGDTWLRATVTAATTYVDGRNGGVGANLIVAGQTYTFSGYMRPTSATASSSSVFVQFYDASSALISTSNVAGPALTNGWTRVSLTDVAPAGAVRAVIILRATSDTTYAIGDRLDVTGILIDRTTGLKSYFDGDTAAVGSTVYSWTGVANASTSLELIDNPADIVTPRLMDGYTAGRASKNTIIDVPGSQFPSVALHPVASRRGTFKFLLGLEADAVKFDALMKQQAAYVLTDTDRGIAAMTFAVDSAGYSLTLDPDTRQLFTAEVAYVEVAS